MNMKRIYIFCLILALNILPFTACQLTGKEQNTNWLPKCDDGQIYIYHQYEEKLLVYDLDKMQIESVNREPNFYQFCFAEDNRIYTSGHSLENYYSVVSVDNNKIDELYTFGSQEAIFPLASIGELFIFIHTFYNDNGNEHINQREICVMDYSSPNSELQIFDNITGYMITHGVCIGDYLYFTSYDPDTNSYSLYSIEYNDLESKPQLIQDGLSAPELFDYNGTLVTSDRSYIYVDDSKYLKESINYIYRNSLLQIGPNADGDLAFKAIDLVSGEEYYSADKIIDFRFMQNTTIMLYGEGYMNEIQVS